MKSNSDDRRLGGRRLAEGRLGWRPPFTSSWLARRREAKQSLIALVEDVSVTGARLTVPRTAGVEVGALAGVEVDGHDGQVEIRWVAAQDDPASLLVGVSFHRFSPELERRIHDLISEDRRETVDWRWEIAR